MRLSWPATALVYVMRGLPLIMVIFWVYFFLPALLGRRPSNVGGLATPGRPGRSAAIPGAAGFFRGSLGGSIT